MRRRAVKVELATSSEDACHIHVYGTQIESALLNLLDNAADASPPGAVVRIEAAPSARDAREGIELRVHDSGKGIDAGTLAHIFDPFFSTKAVGEGTGLGLSLARRFVEEHAGELSIESKIGEGTTARLWLPASHANTRPGREVRRTPPARPRRRRRGGRSRNARLGSLGRSMCRRVGAPLRG